MTQDASALEYALLGLLLQGPRSGYDLRRIFVSTPISVFSDSPGAIYPALRRLARRRWIAAAAGTRRTGRRRQVFSPTAAGRVAFGRWLRRPPSRDDVVRRWDTLMLRLAFMSGNTEPGEVVEFLSALQRELDGHLAGLEAFRVAQGDKLTFSGALAFESGIEGYRATSRWLRRTLTRSRERRRA
ncbi:MAG TPA: helix-turn-helix transcriptional regulator [Vicinamibacteria bacterium]|nr:helix-turn-helix transcriptional regulator [Vicinamibacteria bacterium]